MLNIFQKYGKVSELVILVRMDKRIRHDNYWRSKLFVNIPRFNRRERMKNVVVWIIVALDTQSVETRKCQGKSRKSRRQMRIKNESIGKRIIILSRKLMLKKLGKVRRWTKVKHVRTPKHTGFFLIEGRIVLKDSKGLCRRSRKTMDDIQHPRRISYAGIFLSEVNSFEHIFIPFK